ncbi:PhzF family phenazine biosynthesis protein [Aliiroseovarius sp.]|uniref:PhzF family phenazine biosynthesis protein n=1 Tax=Aliiroseovarius sp. TaxID=1872442 RepID=UPI003BADB10E
MAYEFDWVDAFTSSPFGGNGCVVVHGAADLSIDDRLALVRETSLSECAYLVGSDKADFGARYYVADKEILMAGHPTVATVVSLVDRGLVDLSSGRAAFTLEVGAGVLPIEVKTGPKGPIVTMTQLAPVFGATHDPARIAAMYGLEAGDVVGTPQIVSTGTPFCIVVLKDKEALRRATLRSEAWEALNPPGTLPGDLVEPFLVTLGGETAIGDTFSRLLLPAPMPPEDPFTGSATGCMAAYLWHHGLINQTDFIAEQGHWMGRPGAAQVEVLGPREAPTGVKVGGPGRVLMRGELLL